MRTLKTHVGTVHEMEKPKCYESFKKGGENEFSCHICDKKFTVGPSLKTYMEIVHGMRNQKVMKTSKREVKTNFHVIFATRYLQWDLH